MVKIIKSYYCDICKDEVKDETALTSLQLPVFYHYDDTEFKICDPYIEYQDLDLCPRCLVNCIKVHSYAAGRYEIDS